MSGPVRGHVVGSAVWRPGTAEPLRWQPEVVSRDLPDDIVHRVLADGPSALPPASAVPRRLGDVDRPYRLALSPPGSDGLVCLRATTAGRPDASGALRLRLAGLLVDPSVIGSAVLRPADLWDADIWSMDPGPRPGRDLRRGSLDDAGLTAFARAHPDQREVVLAAVSSTMRSGGPLLVVGDEPAAAAHWAWLVGRLLLPVATWLLPFSTYERLVAPRPAGTLPFALAGVPGADASAVGAIAELGATVLGDREQPVRGGRDRWVLRSGTAVSAGPWARLAETVVVLDLLPEVARRVDALAAEVGGAGARRPLWALAAAVLLLDDADDLTADAAALARDEWPAGVPVGAPLVTRVLELVREHAPPPVVAAPSARPDAWWETARGRVPADAGESLSRTWFRLSGAVRRGVETARERARERQAEAGDLPSSLLSVAALLDDSPALAEDRRQIAELAREVLVPAVLDRSTDPLRDGWEPVADWLWEELVPELEVAPQLTDGRGLPGTVLSAATHEWLGHRSLPVGPLTVAALQRTGPVEWERAAHRLHVRRGTDVTPLERAAAFLAAVSFGAGNGGTPVERWAGRAAEAAYPHGSLDLDTARVLMEVLPADIPFAWVLGAVLQRTPPGAVTRAAVLRLLDREVVPPALQRLIEWHLG
ncbi:hypothetical protein [Geodermatophilus tzadiensis]|uniref:GAP1-M domain-containing protein n=1 Tax=Geodermatophilus tzadiensis TaxID=1137988 RepID=UPI001472BB48|nr:hypothetical protein [Geodermatophilus tzadiensis]